LQPNGTAERDAALVMIEEVPGTQTIRVRADKACDTKDFVAEARNMNVTPHVARNAKGRRSAIGRRATPHVGYAISQHVGQPCRQLR